METGSKPVSAKIINNSLIWCSEPEKSRVCFMEIVSNNKARQGF